MDLSSFISNLSSNFLSIQFSPCAGLCAGLWEHGGDSDLGPVLSGLSEASQPLAPPPPHHYSALLQPSSPLSAVSLGDSSLPLGLAEGSSSWRAVTTRLAVGPVSAGE